MSLIINSVYLSGWTHVTWKMRRMRGLRHTTRREPPWSRTRCRRRTSARRPSAARWSTPPRSRISARMSSARSASSRPDSSGTVDEFRCPFHGWSWQLDGQIKNIPCRWDFPHVSDEGFRLPEVKVELWGGFVFINMDPNAKPLADQLGPMAEHFSGRWDISKRRVALHVVRRRLPAVRNGDTPTTPALQVMQ